MGTAWLLTAIAFIIIFVEVDGWAGSDAHPIIGCITTGHLAFHSLVDLAFRYVTKFWNQAWRSFSRSWPP